MLETDINPDTVTTGATIYLKDYQPSAFLISHVDLDIKLGNEHTIVSATLSVQRNAQNNHTLNNSGQNNKLVLDGEKLTLLSVAIDGEMLDQSDYQLNEQSLSLNSVPDDFSLQIKTQLQPHLNTELSGLYQSSGNFCTQCEAEGFRRITYFLDRPDVLSEYKVTMTADKASNPVLLSNGNLVATGDNDDGTHWAQWHDPHPKPCYLFALVAGDLQNISDSFTTMSGEQVELNIYTQAHNIDKCQHAMDSLKHSMEWDERVYGREYDLSIYNIVAVDDFNMGAMENKGLNVFNSKFVLANQQTATDSDYEGIESVIGHEYFHNWSGNRVTCRDWFQLSLKEGFTVFRDQEFSADRGSRAVKRIRDVQLLRAHQFKEDAGPMAHPIRPDSYQEINNFYTVTIYDKGAEVIRMMHRLVGEAGFRKGTDLYFERFDGQAVTTEDFVQAMEDANQVDLSQFRFWYTQAGTPVVRVEQSFKQGRLTLKMSQHCPDTPNQTNKHAFQIPISLALFAVDGDKLLEQTLELTKSEQEFSFDNLNEQAVVSILRDFSAPIKCEFDQSDTDLEHLIAFDDNGFSRWEAMQRLSLNLVLPAIKNGGVLNDDAYKGLLRALRVLIDSAPSDKAILSEMLKLPSLAYIAEQCSPIDPIAIHQVKQDTVQRLASDLAPNLMQLYTENHRSDSFSLSADAMAERALKNVCLSYLTTYGGEENYQRAEQQFYQANNMTDRLAAFVSLLDSEYQNKAALINDFYQDWQDDTLVLDKWFALQASVNQRDGLAAVQALKEHAAFSMNNPNKVRALIGAFTMNAPSFHNRDGSGYAFFADQIIKLNTINPQIAARLVGTFNNWKAYAEPYQSMMQDQLKRIYATEHLSKNVAEIVGKALS